MHIILALRFSALMHKVLILVLRVYSGVDTEQLTT